MHSRWSAAATLFLVAVALLSCTRPALAQTRPAASEDEEALASATHGLCKAKVAMLGEIATHGDGHTLAFKVSLVERLVDQCGFNAVFFEANQDEFLHLDQQLRNHQSVTPQDLLTAVGGIWKFYKEFQPLSPFLLDRAREGRVTLAGLDDQLAQLGQTYANEAMIVQFARLLPAAEQQDCISAFHKRVYFDYSADEPYSEADKSQMELCLTKEKAAVAVEGAMSPDVKEEWLEMLSATKRWIDRDLSPEGEKMANRDRSMFQTFRWQQQRLPKNSKIIVWAATIHIAKRGNPTWGDRAGTNLGSFLHQEFGERAKSLGFSAMGGSFRQGKGNFPLVPQPPADSVEATAFQGSHGDAVYIGSKQLTALGARPGAFFLHSYQTLPWSEFLDAVVVFRAEHPPTDVR